MRILIALPCLMRGGTEMQTLSLSTALISLGHKVSILCYFEYDKTVVAEFEISGAIVITLNLTRKCGFKRLVLDLRKAFRADRPDLVHVQYMCPGAIPILAAKLAGINRIFALVHQPWTKSHGIKSKILLRTASFLTTRFISVSQNAERSWFGSSSLFDENKSCREWSRHFTIYNTVNTSKIKEIVDSTDKKLLKKKFEIPEGPIVIGAVSRLRHEKGIDLLIDSFISLLNEGQNIHLIIVGSGPDEEKLKQKVISQKYSSMVTFCGAAEWSCAIALMSISDIFVVPSRFEGFGLSAAEAMSAGKPIIASDCFGLTEIVDHEVTGLLFRTGDNEELTKALRKLLKNPALVKLYGDQGLVKVKAKFDRCTMINKLKVLYKSESKKKC